MAVENLTTGIGQNTVAEMVQITLLKNTVLRPLFSDMSQFATPGSKQVQFPRITTNFTVQNLSGGVKADSQALVYDTDNLELDKEQNISFIIRRFDQAKSKVPLLENAIMQATKKHAIQLDQDIYDAFSASVPAANIVTAGALSQAKITEMIQKANEARMPREGRAFVFANDTYADLIAINAFVDASANGRNAPIATGEIGTLYGIPVFQSDVVTSGESWLVHRDALAYAFGALPQLEDQKKIEFGSGSRLWSMDQLYGVKSLNENKLVVKHTLS